MSNKHILTLDILRHNGADLSMPRDVEFSLVSQERINEQTIREFASRFGWRAQIETVDGLHIAGFTTRLIITDQTIRPLSEAVERFCKELGWDYQGWDAFTYK